MAQATLMPNTATVATGGGVFVSTKTVQTNLEFVPDPNNGFSGTIVIDGSASPSPGSSDWFPIATLVFSAHTTIVDINLYLTDQPWIRARIEAAAVGSISVYIAY